MTVLENVVAPLRSFSLAQLNAGAMSGPEASRAEELLQFVGMRGFPISLAAVAEGLRLAQKKLMAGADAPKEWARGNHQLVLDYVSHPTFAQRAEAP